MNNKSIEDIRNYRKGKKFSTDYIENMFKNNIKKVSQEEADKKGKELLDYLISLKTKRYRNTDFEKVNKMIIQFIESGANLEMKTEDKKDYPLLICIRKNCIEGAFLLIYAGANVNQINNYHTTALMAAARHGYVNLVEYLLLKGADVNARCIDGDNALMSAKRHGQKECFDMLIKYQSSITHKNYNEETIFDLPGNIDFSESIEKLDSKKEEKEEDIIEKASFDLEKIMNSIDLETNKENKKIYQKNNQFFVK